MASNRSHLHLSGSHLAGSNEQPVWTAQPSRQVKLEGQRARFECRLSPPAALEGSALAGGGGGGGGTETGLNSRGLSYPREGVARVSGNPRGIIDGARARGRVTSRRAAPLSASQSGEGAGRASLNADEEDAHSGWSSTDQFGLAEGGDAVQLILWYHAGSSAGNGQPIYSVDARQQHLLRPQTFSSSILPEDDTSRAGRARSGKAAGGKVVNSSSEQQQQQQLVPVKVAASHPADASDNASNNKAPALLSALTSGQAKHYAQAALSSRVKLSVFASNQSAYLLLEQLKLTDAGQYKCRVDFKFARTSYQISQLDVIAPVTQVQINAPASDLWPPAQPDWLDEDEEVGGSQVAGEFSGQAAVGSKADRVDLQCASLDGLILSDYKTPLHHLCFCPNCTCWPSAKLAWWRLDWAPKSRALYDWPIDLNRSSGEKHSLGHLRLTRLSRDPVGSPNSLKVRRKSAQLEEGDATPSSTPAGNSNEEKRPYNEPAYLISANKLPASRIADFQLKLDGHTRRLKLEPLEWGANRSANIHELFSSHVTGGSSAWRVRAKAGADDDYGEKLREAAFQAGQSILLQWMQEKLLETLGDFLTSSLLPEAFLQRRVAASTFQLAPIESLFSSSSSSLSGQVKATPVPSRSLEQEQAGISSGKDLWKLFCHSKLVLYTCGATNTNPLAIPSELLPPNDEASAAAAATTSTSRQQELQRDKLASIPPVFTSLIGQANVRPKWVKLFLVSRKLLATRPGRVIELSPLRAEQSLHLNLAEASSAELHFACQVGESQPEASIEWLAHHHSGATSSQQLELMPDTQVETAALVRGERQQQQQQQQQQVASRKVDEPRLKCFSAAESAVKGAPEPQWSSFRLRNISVEQHETIIECSAFNEKYFLNSRQHSRDQTKVSARVHLNITHVPLVQLELELESDSYPRKGSSESRQKLRKDPHQDQRDLAEAKTIVYGENVTLACSVNFANPTLTESVGWSAVQLNNDTKTLDTTVNSTSTFLPAPSGRPLLVHVLERQPAAATNKHRFIERLIVQFRRPVQRSQSRSQSSSSSSSSSSTEEPEEEEETKEYQLLQLKCTAQNALGRAASNTLKLLIGQPPRCYSYIYNYNYTSLQYTTNYTTSAPISNEPNSDKRDTLVSTNDKDQSVHCPVISDKSSSTFRWLVAGTDSLAALAEQPPKTNNYAAFTTPHKPPISLDTREPIILMSELDSLRTAAIPMDAKFVDSAFEQQHYFYCYASDKFGSNDKKPCLIRILTNFSAALSPDLSASFMQRKDIPHNCTVSLTHSILRMRKGSDHLTTNEDATLFNVVASKSLVEKSKPTSFSDNVLFLLIECKANQGKGIRSGKGVLSEDPQEEGSRLFKFDLYRKGESSSGEYVRNLAKKSIDWTSLSEQHLILELGNEQDFTSQLNSSLKDIEDKHFIIMSTENDATDTNTKRQFNILLHFNQKTVKDNNNTDNNNSNSNYLFESNQGQQQKVAADNFSRISESSGHQDRLWVISSLVFVLILSSFVLVIVGWVCRNTTSIGTSNTTSSSCCSNGSFGDITKTKTQGLDNAARSAANKHSDNTIKTTTTFSKEEQREEGCELNREMYLMEDDDDWDGRQVASSSASSMNGLGLSWNSTSQPTVGVKLRPTVYHKLQFCQTTSKQALALATKQQPAYSQLNPSSHCKSTTNSTSVVRANPYDFLIIDPTPIMTQTDDVFSTNDSQCSHTNLQDQQQHRKAILLIDPPSPLPPDETNTTTDTATITCTIKHHPYRRHHHEVTSLTTCCNGNSNDKSEQQLRPTLTPCFLNSDSFELQDAILRSQDTETVEPAGGAGGLLKKCLDTVSSSAMLMMQPTGTIFRQVTPTSLGVRAHDTTCWRSNEVIDLNYLSNPITGNKSPSSASFRQQRKLLEESNLIKEKGERLSPNSYQTYELNSLGELTLLTDESWSSTFIQDYSDRLNSSITGTRVALHNKQSLANCDNNQCLDCLDVNNSNQNEALAYDFNSNQHCDRHQFHQPSIGAGSFLSSPVVSSTSSTHSSLVSTMRNKHLTATNKRNSSSAKQVERVRFLDVGKGES